MSTKTRNKQAGHKKEQTKVGVNRKRAPQDQTFRPQPSEALQRVANASPAAVRPADVLALQSSAGNRAVQRLVDRTRPRPTRQTLVQRHDEDTVTNVMNESMVIGSGAARIDAALTRVTEAVGDANSEVMEIAEAAQWQEREVVASASESLHSVPEGEGGP